uniref:GNAT family N-acetyltransferase n=1 Tax=Streptomyces calvus TaxID=67282 RepID=UPI003514C45C
MSSLPERNRPRPLPELRGHGLHLRPWNPESRTDVEAWLRGLTDPEFLRWNTPFRPITDLAGARASLRRAVGYDADGTGVSFQVADAGSGTPLGHVGVNEIHPVLPQARIGYWVLPEARGRGVATRALLLAARWALTERRLYRLELNHALGHGASCRIAERCGFRHEGTLRGAILQAGRTDAFRDAHLHARLATDPYPTPPDGTPPATW